MDKSSAKMVTCLLRDAAQGNREAIDKLIPYVYDELRAQAALFLRKERPNHTLQTTALVHEAYLRLINQKDVDWVDRIHFYAVASTCIRRILVDHARRRCAAKRAAEKTKTPLREISLQPNARPEEFIALNEALDRLEKKDHRKARVIELRFFGSLESSEIAEVLSVSENTVRRDLRLARAWLYRALSGEHDS